MTRFSIEVRNETARFDVALTAQSVERALELARRIYPASEVMRVKFPLVLKVSRAETALPQGLAA